MVNKSGLQTINHQKKVALWSDQVADCRSSGQTVSEWCAAHGIPTSTYYTRERRVYEMTSKSSGAFIEVQVETPPALNGSIATVSAGGLTAELHPGADEASMTALFRAMKSC